MAISDYGILVNINGKKIDSGVYINPNLTSELNFKYNEDENLIVDYENKNINKFENKEYYYDLKYQAYFGDYDFYVAVYKFMIIFKSKNDEEIIDRILYDYMTKRYTDKTMRKKVYRLKVNNIDFKIKHCFAERYLLTFKYKNNNYKIYFGYGVDKHMEKFIGHYLITKKEIYKLKKENLL